MVPLVNSAVSLVLSSLSTASQKIYFATLVRFKIFLWEQLGLEQFLPASTSSIALFVSHLFQSGYSSSTIASQLSALSFFHKIFGFSDPSDQFIIRKMVLGVGKTSANTDSRVPISLDMLRKFIDSTDFICDSIYQSYMFKAMYVLMFYAFLRVGEVTNSINNIQYSHVSVSGLSITITFHKYKHHKGPPVVFTIQAVKSKYCPVYITLSYLAKRGSRPGPFFCYPDSGPVNSANFNQILSRSVIWSGFKEFNIKPHSFRIGAATWAAASGFSDAQIQIMGRWRSNAFKKYIRVTSFQVCL